MDGSTFAPRPPPPDDPPKRTPTLILRRDATQKTVDRFEGSEFAWSTNDCIRLAAIHARNMGYKVTLPKAGSYRDVKGAMRALAKTGYPRIEKLLDSYFTPIPWLATLPGDLCAMPPADDMDWPAVFVVLDNGRILGFAGIEGIGAVCRVTAPRSHLVVRGAWRVEPQP